MAAIHCEICNAPLEAEDLNLATGIGKCRYCGAVLDLSQRPGAPEPAAPPVARAPVPLPERFQVEQEMGWLRVRWRWFRPAHVGLIFFCVFWDGFLVFWYRIALSSHGPASTMAVLFPVVHVAVGAFVSYTALTKLFNHTVVEATRQGVTIRHGPLPWSGNQHLERASLKQLYSASRVIQGKNSSTTVYELKALTREGRTVRLLTDLDEPGQALYLEQALEKRLDIQDVPVVGELPRGMLAS